MSSTLSTTRKINAFVLYYLTQNIGSYTLKLKFLLALMPSDILRNEYYDTHEYYLVCVVKIECVAVGNRWAELVGRPDG